MAMIMRTFYLPEDLYASLVQNAKNKNMSVSELVRIRLKKSVEKEENKYLDGTRFLSKLIKIKAKGLPRDLAKNHDKYAWDR